ncbi:MAG: hypothetical protein QXR24_04530 [Thermosphaera sp.]
MSKLLLLKVKSKGCASCTLTAVRHILRIPGVKGVRSRPDYLIVVLDENADPQSVLNDEELNLYYRVVEWRLEQGDESSSTFRLSSRG